MLTHEITGPVLDGLYGHASALVAFPGEVYLGLLTKLPKADGSVYEDGTYFAELVDPNYTRFRLDAVSRINKKYIITDAVDGEAVEVDGDQILPAEVRNQAPLIFPENSVAETIVGFGLFRSADTTDKTALPFAWDAVSDPDGGDAVALDTGETPIIREGGFEMVLM